MVWTQKVTAEESFAYYKARASSILGVWSGVLKKTLILKLNFACYLSRAHIFTLLSVA
jgi:hypothetical protein